MTTVATAVLIADKEEFTSSSIPGSFHVEAGDEHDEHRLWFRCPCGCGAVEVCLVGNGHKPGAGQSWNWNGSLERPTLVPGFTHKGHWQGELTDGEWKQP